MKTSHTLELIRNAQNGCKESANQLVIDNEKLVYHFFYKLRAYKYRNEREDFINIGRVAIYQATMSYNDESVAFSTVASQYIKTRFYNYFKRLNGKTYRMLTKCSSYNIVDEDYHVDVIELMGQEDNAYNDILNDYKLMEALAQMKQEHQDLFHYKYILELPRKDIAKLLNIKVEQLQNFEYYFKEELGRLIGIEFTHPRKRKKCK